MLIQTIEIENFRGIHYKREFSFEGKPFVLLAAPNGLGKTTLIDAIEWCLTGNISRLKNAFDTRSTNEDERRKNVDGILKNKKACEKDFISVILSMIDNDKTYQLIRVQKKDELNPKLSKVWMNGREDLANKLLPQIVDNNFYNFHFCDVQKSIEIQNRKRKDLPDLFTEFITDYTRESNVADNLDLFAEDTARYQQDLEVKKIADTTIKEKQDALNNYKDTPVILKYPEAQIYTGESSLISDLDESMLKKQLELLYKCGYKQANLLLEDILSDDSKKTVSKDLTELANILKGKKNIIDQAIEHGLHNIGPESIANLEKRIKQHKEIRLTKENLWDNASNLITFNNVKFTEAEYNESKRVIKQLEKDLNDMKNEIEILSKGNDVLDSLSSLISKEQGLRKYREEIQQSDKKVNCPVCGSERFGQIEQAEILSSAREYIDQHGLLLADKKIKKDQVDNQINLHYELLIKTCNQILADEIEKEDQKREELVKLQQETTDFFIVQKRLEKLDTETYALAKLVVPDYVDSMQREIEGKFLSIEEMNQKRENYKKILELLDYKEIESESEKIIKQKVQELADHAPELIDFSRSLLIQKINAINSLLNNKKYLELKHGLEAANQQNADIDKQQKELSNISDKAKQHAALIRSLVNQLKADEYHKVGPNLFKYYKKLTRINTIESIQIKQEVGMLSMVDESDKNIVNILSNGQLSVFMLAYFFAGIVSRNKQEACKIYFIDDLTACMDDVNMLAFLDLMKYQLLEKNGVMDQIFFASCDDRVCKLLRYKLNGCGIDFCELREKNFA